MLKAAKLSLFAGIVLMIVPLLTGFALALRGSLLMFRQIGQDGIGNPGVTAELVGGILVSTMAGLVLSVAGGGIVIISALMLFVLRKETPPKSSAATAVATR